MPEVRVRAAADADLAAIAAICVATAQEDEWGGQNPAYIGHLRDHGQVVVAELNGTVAGFGATQQIGTGAAAVSMLCDLFVDPSAHGRGCGRAMLAELWRDAPRRMTFSSLHAHAVPLYTSFGVDAWWPLLYLRGDARELLVAGTWSARSVAAEEVGQLELEWTGMNRTADHRAWTARPGGAALVAARGGQPVAAASIGGPADEYGIVHLATSPAADNESAAAAVLTVLTALQPPGPLAHVCLPAPHPAVRQLLAAGWRFDEFDLFMASEPGLIDPRRAVPSPGQA